MKASKYVITTVMVILLVVFWVIGAKPLSDMVKTAEIDSNIEATLMRSIEIKNADGSITYENAVIEFNEASDSEAAKALIKVMGDVTCRKRGLMLPFEKVVVYSTGQDNISISFTSGGKKVELVLLSGSSTLYDVGSKSRSFDVAEYTFEKLAKVIEEHGSVRPQL